MWISVILIKINFGVQVITNNNIIYDVPTPMVLSHYLLIIKGSFGWKSEKVGGWKISERVKKWEDRKYLVFRHVCLVGGVEKWDDEFFFFLFGWREKWEDGKYNLYKLTIMSLGKWEGVGECNKIRVFV